MLDEPTNHLDMISRNVVENALSDFSGSIVCISHDRHFLNQVTNKTCEVGNGGIKIYDGNYEYFEWKKKEEKDLLLNNDRVVEKAGKNKNSYAEKKRIRNRLTWINKRSNEIDKAIEGLNKEINDPENSSDHSLLKEKLDDL